MYALWIMNEHFRHKLPKLNKVSCDWKVCNVYLDYAVMLKIIPKYFGTSQIQMCLYLFDDHGSEFDIIHLMFQALWGQKYCTGRTRDGATAPKQKCFFIHFLKWFIYKKINVHQFKNTLMWKKKSHFSNYSKILNSLKGLV